MMSMNIDDAKLIGRRNRQLHSFLSAEEERLKATEVKEGVDNMKGMSKNSMAKPRTNSPL